MELGTIEDVAISIAAKADKSNVLELNNVTAFTPDADYEPATKKYVDDNGGGVFEGFNKITVGTVEPIAPQANDIWIDTN